MRILRELLIVLFVVGITWWIWQSNHTSSFSEEQAEDTTRVITLGQDPSTGSRANTELAKQIIEKHLGYQVRTVEIVSPDAMARALITGEVDAALERWHSSTGEAYQRYMKAGIIENLGSEGSVGKSGWYVPAYLLEEYPALETWEGLKGPEILQLFTSEDSGEKGILLSGNPGWKAYLDDIIRNLELDLTVAYSGTEEIMLEYVADLYERKEPVLFYFWRPHLIHLQYNLVEIQLPTYSEECYADADVGGVQCDYPEDVIFKVANPTLKERAPDAYALLKNFQYPSSQEKLLLLAAIEEQEHSFEQGVQQWMAQNPEIWREWLPEE
jgi:glycine betaine/proline transport system substrate-binding protein